MQRRTGEAVPIRSSAAGPCTTDRLTGVRGWLALSRLASRAGAAGAVGVALHPPTLVHRSYRAVVLPRVPEQPDDVLDTPDVIRDASSIARDHRRADTSSVRPGREWYCGSDDTQSV